MELRGKIKSGYGNASFWVDKINDIFEERYNMKLFLGTLNILLDKPYVIEEGTDKILKSEYGGIYDVLIKKCKILNHDAYLVRPDKNNTDRGDHKPDTIEIVCNLHLRKENNLKDNDEVTVEIV